jgi:hypothetical protein
MRLRNHLPVFGTAATLEAMNRLRERGSGLASVQHKEQNRQKPE